jgi:hypothetical protein
VQQLAVAAQAGGPCVRGQVQEQRLQPGGERPQFRVGGHERAGIGGRELRDLCGRPAGVVPRCHHLAAVQGHLQRGLARHHPQPVGAQIQLLITSGRSIDAM